MEAPYNTQQQQQRPLMSGAGAASSFDEFATSMLAPAHWGTLPLALMQHPSPQLAALAVALLLALQTTAPVAGAWAMLAAALLSAAVQLIAHGGSGSAGGARPSRGPPGSRGPPSNRKGPGAFASLSLDAAVAIAAASWLACWA
jgi:hypothetical protein